MNFLRNIGADLVEKRLWPVALALIIGVVAVPMLLASSASDRAGHGRARSRGERRGQGRDGRQARHDARRPSQARRLVEEPLQAALRTQGEGRAAAAGRRREVGCRRRLRRERAAAATTPARARPDTTPKPKAKPKDANLDVYRVNLRFGQPGAMKSVHDVPRLTPLPSVEDPFFVYLGVKEDGKTLVFLVSSDAKATGDGKCQPTQDSCETIEMKVGDTEMFDVTTEGVGVQQYQMDVVSIKKSKASSAKAARKARARHSKAGAALLTLAREGADRPTCSVATAGTRRAACWTSWRARRAPPRSPSGRSPAPHRPRKHLRRLLPSPNAGAKHRRRSCVLGTRRRPSEKPRARLISNLSRRTWR